MVSSIYGKCINSHGKSNTFRQKCGKIIISEIRKKNCKMIGVYCKTVQKRDI